MSTQELNTQIRNLNPHTKELLIVGALLLLSLVYLA